MLRMEAVTSSVLGCSVLLQEEEEGSEEDSNVKPDFTITMKTDFNVRSFLDQLEDDADGFVSPVDDKMPSRSNQDMGLSNLHEASMYVEFAGNLKKLFIAKITLYLLESVQIFFHLCSAPEVFALFIKKCIRPSYERVWEETTLS